MEEKYPSLKNRYYLALIQNLNDKRKKQLKMATAVK